MSDEKAKPRANPIIDSYIAHVHQLLTENKATLPMGELEFGKICKDAAVLMQDDSDDEDIPGTSLSRGENKALCLQSSNSALLNFFFSSMVRKAPIAKVVKQLAAAWQENAEDTIRILLHARDCRHGKGEKAVVLYCLMWLRVNKPRTYLANLRHFLEVGYYKDLLQVGVLVDAQKLPPLNNSTEMVELQLFASDLKDDYDKLVQWQQSAPSVVAEEREKEPEKEQEKVKVSEAKEEEEVQVVIALEGDADQKKRKERVEDEEPAAKRPKHCSLSLCAKWTPTERSAFDKKAKFAKRMAFLMFPQSKTANKDYRQAVSMLRSHLKVTEKFMCSNEWSEIEYGSVPAKSHRLHRKAFLKHEPVRYQTYLDALAANKAKINVKGTQPHELVRHYMHNGAFDQTIEGQWATIIADLKANSAISQSLAVVDVSGSMHGEPMEVAIALGLVTATINGGLFHDKVITFHENPQLHTIAGQTLEQKVHDLENMSWGYSTDLLKVFHIIISTAQRKGVPQKEMPEMLFIFSDMQFNTATHVDETTFSSIRAMFAKSGYQMPQIVFWNLRGDTKRGIPVSMDQNGVALMSGFSAELLKVFFEGCQCDPVSMMQMAIQNYPAVVHPDEK